MLETNDISLNEGLCNLPKEDESDWLDGKLGGIEFARWMLETNTSFYEGSFNLLKDDESDWPDGKLVGIEMW